MMKKLHLHIQNYLVHCRTQKCLDEKTLKAYRIDLRQFSEYMDDIQEDCISATVIENYMTILHQEYQPKTVRRKIASLKAFFHFLQYKDILSQNPFDKIQLHFREPIKLPKTIPLYTIEALLSSMYEQASSARTAYQRTNALRDAAITELLFSSGLRISELCSLQDCDVNLQNGTILIHGKGNKERRLQLGNETVLHTLRQYRSAFIAEINQCGHFFATQKGRPVSDQMVRRMLRKYCANSSITLHITPHMFRHTFATCLLEADVDIRYIQEMLGHSSITVTEIYTHVAVAKQREILLTKHPRKDFRI